jgi:hypothetical protein
MFAKRAGQIYLLITIKKQRPQHIVTFKKDCFKQQPTVLIRQQFKEFYWELFAADFF